MPQQAAWLLLWLVSLNLVIIQAAQMPGGLITVNTKNNRLIDQDGRERIFHGTNVVYKEPPYHPITDHFDFEYSFSVEDYQNLQEWGLNSVRLGVMWPGVEPKRGEYNETYLALMQKIVEDSAKYGIYTLIDMHQDIFARKFCGEGVPDWAAIPSSWVDDYLRFPEPLAPPFEYQENGLPSPEDCAKFNWYEYSVTVALGSAVQNLYDNYNGTQARFAAYWNKLARTWNSNTAVLGYELMNEPWAGDIWHDPELLVPGVADVRNLAPMYENLNKAIRAADDQHCVWFEGVTWDDVTVGFTQVPGGDVYRNRSVMSYHVYVPPEISYTSALYVRHLAAQRLGCGWFMTEHNGNDVGAFDICDQYLQGWMGWEYKAFAPITGYSYGFWFQNGSINTEAVKVNSRTYAQAIAGESQSMTFNAFTNVFQLVYQLHKNCTLPTEIYIHKKMLYPRGVNVQILPAGMAKWSNPTPNQILIVPLPTTPDLTILSVTISPM